jgi:hypothetical protein
MRELFIYYRSQAQHAQAVEAAVAAFQHGLRERHARLEARLLRRDESPSMNITWMETYRLTTTADRPGIDAQLQAEIELLAVPALAGLLDGQRHVEAFEPCAS